MQITFNTIQKLCKHDRMIVVKYIAQLITGKQEKELTKEDLKQALQKIKDGKVRGFICSASAEDIGN